MKKPHDISSQVRQYIEHFVPIHLEMLMCNVNFFNISNWSNVDVYN